MTGFGVPASGLLHLRMSRQYQARRTTVWESKFKQARVGAIDPGAWDLPSSSSIFHPCHARRWPRACLIKRKCRPPQMSGMLLRWTRRRLLAQLSSREEPLEGTHNTILAPYTGGVWHSAMKPLSAGPGQRQMLSHTRPHNDCVDQVHPRSNAKHPYVQVNVEGLGYYAFITIAFPCT